MTPLATRIRDLLARTGKPPKRESEAARHARESGCLIVGRRDCEAVLALIDAAKEARAALDDSANPPDDDQIRAMLRYGKADDALVAALRALEE